MGQTFMPKIKTEEELRALQLEGLKWTAKHAYQGSEYRPLYGGA